jgi:hypothetical protein
MMLQSVNSLTNTWYQHQDWEEPTNLRAVGGNKEVPGVVNAA